MVLIFGLENMNYFFKLAHIYNSRTWESRDRRIAKTCEFQADWTLERVPTYKARLYCLSALDLLLHPRFSSVSLCVGSSHLGPFQPCLEVGNLGVAGEKLGMPPRGLFVVQIPLIPDSAGFLREGL